MTAAEKIEAVTPAQIHLADPRFSRLLLDLHGSRDFDEFFTNGEKLLRTALPTFHCLAAIACVGIAPMFLRTSLPIRDLPGYWARFYRSRPPLADIVESKPGIQIAVLSRDVDQEKLLASDFYRDFMIPDGWRYSVGFLFWEGVRFRGQFSFIRTEEQGDYTAEELSVLEVLYPHFNIALSRIEEIDRERAHRRSVEAALNATPEGRIVLDWNLAEVYRNRTAIEACAVWKSGSLNTSLGAKEQARQFCLPDEIGAAAGALLVEFCEAVRQDNHRTRTWQANIRHATIPGLSAGIRILETKTPQAVEPGVLIELSRLTSHPNSERAWPIHTLTASERRVAELAATGETNDQIAGSLGVSVHTVRAHLREVFSKLEVQRRSQLAEVMRADLSDHAD